jgi:hypothetical protein
MRKGHPDEVAVQNLELELDKFGSNKKREKNTLLTILSRSSTPNSVRSFSRRPRTISKTRMDEMTWKLYSSESNTIRFEHSFPIVLISNCPSGLGDRPAS